MLSVLREGKHEINFAILSLAQLELADRIRCFTFEKPALVRTDRKSATLNLGNSQEMDIRRIRGSESGSVMLKPLELIRR